MTTYCVSSGSLWIIILAGRVSFQTNNFLVLKILNVRIVFPNVVTHFFWCTHAERGRKIFKGQTNIQERKIKKT